MIRQKFLPWIASIILITSSTLSFADGFDLGNVVGLLSIHQGKRNIQFPVFDRFGSERYNIEIAPEFKKNIKAMLDPRGSQGGYTKAVLMYTPFPEDRNQNGEVAGWIVAEESGRSPTSVFEDPTRTTYMNIHFNFLNEYGPRLTKGNGKYILSFDSLPNPRRSRF